MGLLLVCGVISTSAFAQITESKEAQHLPFPDDRFTINGLPWFNEDKPVLRRLPARLKDTFRPPVWGLAQSPSGGRIRFKTDSKIVGIVAQSPNNSMMHHMTIIGESGFDLYSDGEYIGSAWPERTNSIVKEWSLGRERKLRDITIYLPLYKGVTVQEIVLEKGAKLEAPGTFALPKPVVYYGSSITQGGCASNPGTSCQAYVSRWLNVDFVNLGFSGNGMGEPAVAQAISEIDAACFVLDYWGNPKPDVYKQTMPGFVDILRKKYPTTPIIICSPYYTTGETTGGGGDSVEKRKIASEFVAARKQAGDQNIYYVNGLEMLSREQADGLVDGGHANSLGFYFNAKGLEPYLREVLHLTKAELKK